MLGAIERLRELIHSNENAATKFFYRELNHMNGNVIAQFEFAKFAAISGLHDAIHYVVQAYQEGVGVEPNRVKAFEWIFKAATEKKKTGFAFDLACCFRDGDGTLSDADKGWEWMKTAAEEGDTEAMFQLVMTYLNPERAEFSPERAIEWTNKLVDRGSPSALTQVARKYDDGESVDKDPGIFLRYARRAVEAASLQLDNTEDWAYEDLPLAMAALADAFERNDKMTEARNFSAKAATAAWDAYSTAKKKNLPISPVLPEIMLRMIHQCRGQSGKILREREHKYITWLERVNEVTSEVFFAEGRKDVPPDLLEAIYDLSIAYKDGVGVKPNRTRYLKTLRHAADAGHGRAAYVCAMRHLKKNEMLEFNQLISLAADANDIDAMIAQQLVSIKLSTSRLDQALRALKTLRSTVVDIQDKKHKIESSNLIEGIAHYTDAGALTSMLSGSPLDSRNAIRLSSIVYVNDPTEGKRLRDFTRPAKVNPLAELCGEMTSSGTISWLDREFHVFIACFSQQRDSLNLWRFYGRDGMGYCIMIPPSVFNGASKEGMIRGPWTKRLKQSSNLTLYKVLYDDKSVEDTLKTLEQALKPTLNLAAALEPHQGKKIKGVAIAVISELLYLYKDAQYADEKEVRAVEARTLSDPEIKDFHPANKMYSKLYLETSALLFRAPGSEIIIGPKVADHEAVTIDLQHQLARLNWSSTCKVTRSTKAYR